MRIWIVAKTFHKEGKVHVHALTEKSQNIRVLGWDGSYPDAKTKLAIGQIWDVVFTPFEQRESPFEEDVIVTKWRRLDDEPDLRTTLLERVQPWRGGLDQLFNGYLKIVMNDNKPFLAEHDAALRISMGYWIPNAPLVEWHVDEQGNELLFPCYRYYHEEQKLLIRYKGLDKQVRMLPADTLAHVALQDWWTPENKYAEHKDSRVERRCYLYIAGWYS